MIEKKKYEILGCAFLTGNENIYAQVDIPPNYDPENEESVIAARFWWLSRRLEEMNKLPPDTTFNCPKRTVSTKVYEF